jgi:uncharacterized protein (DUF4415 family)
LKTIVVWHFWIESMRSVSKDGTPLEPRLSNKELRWYCWSFTYTGRRTIMAKKSSASSQPAELRKTRSADIRNRRWTEQERQTLRRHAAKQAAGDESDLDFGDIPRLTDEQLAQMVRLRDVRPKVPVSVRLEPRVLEWLKSKGSGHLTRINDILRNIMEAEQRISHR